MTKVKTLIMRAPGTNCDVESAFAFERAGAQVDLIHVNELIRRQRLLSNYQIMVIPGGFTYGDDVSAGRILANELRLKLGDEIQKFVDDGRLILGICNGFQVLVKAGVLPESRGENSQSLTLAGNDSGRFECRWVYLRANKTSPCIFTRGINLMYLPVAHGEGKVIIEPGALEELNVALYYADETGDIRGWLSSQSQWFSEQYSRHLRCYWSHFCPDATPGTIHPLDATSKVDQRTPAGLWGRLPHFSERCGVGQEHLNKKERSIPAISLYRLRKMLVGYLLYYLLP